MSSQRPHWNIQKWASQSTDLKIAKAHLLQVKMMFMTWSVSCAVLSHSIMSDSVTSWSIAYEVPLSTGILQARILEWVALLQEIFPIQGSNPGIPHRGQILYHLSHKGSPRILKWVAYPFSRGSSQPRNRTGVSWIVGRFFTSWATREAQSVSYVVTNTHKLGSLKSISHSVSHSVSHRYVGHKTWHWVQWILCLGSHEAGISLGLDPQLRFNRRRDTSELSDPDVGRLIRSLLVVGS